MSKEEFLRELEQDLAARGVEDRAAYRDFFEEIYEDMREEGLTEEEAAGRLGDPRKIAEALAAEAEAQGENRNTSAEDSTDPRKGHAESGAPEGPDTLRGLKGLAGLSGLSGLGKMINDIVKNVVKAGGAGSVQGFADHEITFPVQGIQSVEVVWLDGDVEVTAAERVDIRLCESRPAGAEPLYAALLGDTLRIAYTEAAGRQEGSGFYTDGTKAKGKDLQIELPRALAGNLQQLKLRTASGDLEVSGIKARSIFLTTASGDMEGHHLSAEEMHVECVSGDAELELAAKRLFAKSVSGDLDLTLRESPESLAVRSVSGDIEVRLPEGSACRLQHQSVSGDVHVRGIAGNVPGAPEYSFSTVSGDIEIRTV